jgi:hypothetical protein
MPTKISNELVIGLWKIFGKLSHKQVARWAMIPEEAAADTMAKFIDETYPILSRHVAEECRRKGIKHTDNVELTNTQPPNKRKA